MSITCGIRDISVASTFSFHLLPMQRLRDSLVSYSSKETIWKKVILFLNCYFFFRIPGDSMWKHDGMYFSTYDSDNDNWSNNCATTYHGAWWYNACHWANLNAEYGNTKYGKGINWNSWKGVYYSMKEVKMMVRKP